MINFLREILSKKLDDLDGVATATGIDVDELRSFLFGKYVLSGFDLDQLASYFNLKLVPRMAQDLLPLESKAVRGIQIQFAEQLQFCGKLLKFALRLIGLRPDYSGELPKITKLRGLSCPTIHMSLGVYTKILKPYRSIIALCEIGLVKDAGAIERCMFESVLACNFLLRPRVKLKENGKPVTHVGGVKETKCPHCKAIIRPAAPPTKLRKLGTLMRHTLYAAHDCISTERELDAYLIANLPTLAKALGDEILIRDAAKKSRRRIGAGWAQRQKEKKSFAGVSIKDLAESYRLLDYYICVYRRQSKTVHGADGIDFVTPHPNLKLDLGPSTEKLETILHLASALLIGTMEPLNQRLGLGFDGEVKDYVRHLKDWAKRF